MTRQDLIKSSFVIGMGAGVSLFSSSGFADQAQKPNVVFVFSDQQRWDTLGCYGQKLSVTPVLDNLAKEGVLFRQAFTPQPLCTPARGALQTGKYASQCGVYWNGCPLPKTEKTLAHYFRDAGYDVGYVGKWHLASVKDEKGRKMDAVTPEYRGGYNGYWIVADAPEATSHANSGYLFDGDMNKVEMKGYRTDAMTDFGLEFIHRQSKSKPFFLLLSYIEPHQQNDLDKVEGPEGSKEKFADFAAPADLANSEKKGNWKENYPDYLGACNSIDTNVGRIIAALKEQGLYENTILVFSSDHGCHFKTRDVKYKQTAHEASIHIPLIISGPGFHGGKAVDEMVGLIDLAPTLLAAAGISKPDNMPGTALQGLASGKPAKWRDDIFIQFCGSHHGRAIRTKKWKYSVYSTNKEKRSDPFIKEYEEQYLYDLERDPYELKNLVQDPAYSEVRKELSAKLLKYIREVENIDVKINFPPTGNL